MRYTLQTLLLLFVVVWSALAAFGPWGLLPTLYFAGAVAYVRRAEPKLPAIKNVVVFGGIGLVLLALVLPPIETGRSGAQSACCRNNLKQIGLALLEYEIQYGCLPPAYVADTNRKPMHSWRVLILPYLGQKGLYEQYDFDEPWDGPNNSKLAATMPDCYKCPSSDRVTNSAATNYVAVVGAEAAWPGAASRKLKEIHDEPGNTILLVEVPGSDINWMEPRDLSFDEAVSGISSHHQQGAGSFVPDKAGVHVLSADAGVHFLPHDVPREALGSLLSVDDGASVELDDFDPQVRRRKEANRRNRGQHFALAILFVSLGLLLFRPRRRRAQETISES